jgi:energy-coupling factor transporter ATP-binding protein EcfA2
MSHDVEFPFVRRVTSLTLSGVRGVPYHLGAASEPLKLNTDADIVLISAPNGHGKSTVIEALLFLLTGACAPGRNPGDLVHRSGTGEDRLMISARCKTNAAPDQLLRVSHSGADGTPRFDEGAEDVPAKRPRCVDRRFWEAAELKPRVELDKADERDAGQLAETMRRACLYSPDSPTASTDETALSHGGRSFADLFRRRNLLRAAIIDDAAPTDRLRERLDKARRSIASLRTEADLFAAQRGELRAGAERAVDLLVSLVESVFVAAQQAPPKWASHGLSRLPEVATALQVGIVVGTTPAQQLLDSVVDELARRIAVLRDPEEQRKLAAAQAERGALAAKRQSIATVDGAAARELAALGQLFTATADAPERYLKTIKKAVEAGTVDKRVLDEVTRLDVPLARQLAEGLQAVYADAARMQAERAALDARIDELTGLIGKLERKGAKEREALEAELRSFKDQGAHRQALLEYAKARAANNAPFMQEVEEKARQVEVTLAFLDTWVKVARQIPKPVAEAYREFMKRFMGRFRVAGGSEIVAAAHDDDSPAGPSFRHALSGDRTLGRMSSGQASQVAVASMLAQNHILGAFTGDAHVVGLPHRLLFLDDVSTTYDRGNLLRETLLWRQLAYGPEDEAERRQLFITSHLDDLNRQLVDMLAPPPGRSLIVYFIRKWDPKTGPVFEGYKIGATADPERVQRAIPMRLPDFRRDSEVRSA